VASEPHQSFSVLSAAASTPFRRRFVLPTWITLVLEVIAVVLPLWVIFDLGALPAGTIVRTALPAGLGAWLVWALAVTAWLLPIRRLISAREKSQRLDKEQVNKAYRNSISGPLKGLALRTMLWTGAAGATGVFLHLYFAAPLLC
jgi:hypothetical protein